MKNGHTATQLSAGGLSDGDVRQDSIFHDGSISIAGGTVVNNGYNQAGMVEMEHTTTDMNPLFNINLGF